MNYSVYRFTLNMHNHRSQVAIPVFLGDTGIRLHINLTDGGNPYIIEDGCTAYIRGKKPDGKGLFNPCLILNNTMIQYDFTEQTSNREGITTCEIELYGKDGTLITAPKFIIVVDSRSLSDSEIAEIIEDSDSEVGIIPKIIATIASEESRVEAEKIREANELERQAKETERQANEVKRIALYEGVNNSVANLDTRISENDRRITNLENKALSFVTDTDVGYTKDVPENALPYALISKIGGFTNKCDNLLNIANTGSETKNGLTLTFNGNGTFTINGTSTAQTSFYYRTAFALPTGTFFIKLNASGMGWSSYWGGVANEQTGTERYDVGAGYSFTSDNNTFTFYVTIVSGKTLNNVVFKPMVNVGTSALPFEPYFSGLRDARVTEVKSVGVNKVNPAEIPDTRNGMTFTKNLDGSVTINGTCNAYTTIYVYNFPIKQGERFYVFGGGSGTIFTFNGHKNGAFVKNVGTAINDSVHSIVCDGTYDEIFSIILINSGTSFSNVNVKFMVSHKPFTEFSPYQEHTLAIPEAVQSLDSYGCGINSSLYNYIDFESKKFNRVVKKITFNGTESWNTGSGLYYLKVTGMAYANGISNKESEYMSIRYEQLRFSVTDRYATVTDWKTQLQEWYANGTPLEVVYVLDVPTTEDISEIDNIISVEGGGTLIFENEYGYDVASTVYYQLEGVAE